MPNLLERKTNKTEYDILEGFERYINNALQVIHHTDDIQRLRTFENTLRYNLSDAGLEEKYQEIMFSDKTTEEKQKEMQEYFPVDKTQLANFVTWIDETTNLLAGKKARIDRIFENHIVGRALYDIGNSIDKRISDNMLVYNLSTALNNIFPIAQSLVELNPVDSLKSLFDTIADKDDFKEKSPWMINRIGSERLAKTNMEKIKQFGYKPTGIVDIFGSELINRAKYNEGIRKGLSEKEALDKAYEFTSSIMADRSQGQQPNIFSNKNLIVKILTKFQLEPLNMYNHYIKDIIKNQDVKSYKKLIALIGSLGTIYLASEFKENMTGSRIMKDPIYLAKNFVNDMEKRGTKQAFNKLLSDIESEIPIWNNFRAFAGVEGGRIPLAAAVPNMQIISNSIIDIFSENTSSKVALNKIGKELLKPLTYLVPPFGGGQIKKTIEGIAIVKEGGSYTTDKEGKKELQFPVKKTVGNYIKGGMFGKWSLKGKDYNYNNKLNAKNTEIYNKNRDSLSFNEMNQFVKTQKTEEETKRELQLDKINKMTVTNDVKFDLYKNNILSEKDRQDGTTQVQDAEYMIKNGVSKKEFMQSYDKLYKNNLQLPSRDDFKKLKESGTSLNTYANYKVELSKLTKELKTEEENIKSRDKIELLLKGNYTNKEKTAIFENFIAPKNDKEYKELMKYTDVNIKEYLEYKTQNFQSDIEDNGTTTGNPINGSKKEKVVNYVEKMNIPYEQKLLLLGKRYKLTNGEMRVVSQYINDLYSSQTINATERLKMFENLQGFTAYKDGRITYKGTKGSSTGTSKKTGTKTTSKAKLPKVTKPSIAKMPILKRRNYAKLLRKDDIPILKPPKKAIKLVPIKK